MANEYDQGELVRVRGTFRDPNNSDALIDPTAIMCSYKSPTGALVTLEYGTDAELTRVSSGLYQVYIDTTPANGLWYYRFYSTGTGQAAKEATFIVLDAAAS